MPKDSLRQASHCRVNPQQGPLADQGAKKTYCHARLLDAKAYSDHLPEIPMAQLQMRLVAEDEAGPSRLSAAGANASSRRRKSVMRLLLLSVAVPSSTASSATSRP